MILTIIGFTIVIFLLTFISTNLGIVNDNLKIIILNQKQIYSKLEEIQNGNSPTSNIKKQY